MTFPRDSWVDSTLALLNDPYRYISRRAAELATHGFETRILGQRTVCITGRDAAELFYTPGAISREGAAPARVRRVIFGPEGVVQGLDGEAHKQRKALFLDLLADEGRQDSFAEMLEIRLTDRIMSWSAAETVDLYYEVRRLLTDAVFAWAGLPLSRGALEETVRPVTALFEKAGSVGPPHWRGLLARRRMQGRIGQVIEDIRAGRRRIAPSTPAAQVARWSDVEGRLLDPQIAAAELLNLLRPVVAVSVYVVQLAHALRNYPAARSMAAEGDAQCRAVVQEVRRFYPFFPLVAGFAAQDLTLGDDRIPKGRKVALDLWGTSRDPASWTEPELFRPERFINRDISAFDMTPQGGGAHAVNHRCPGEWITIRIMERFARLLAQELSYEVKSREAGLNMRALPALPKGGFTLRQVRQRGDA